MRIRPPPLDPQGFTLLELTLVMLAIGILTAVLLTGPDPGQFSRVHGEAQAVRAEMAAALAAARATEGDAVFYVDPAVDGGARGRFLALAGPPGIEKAPAETRWRALHGGVQWGWGAATRAPDGAATLPMYGTVRCRGGRECWLGGRKSLVYYFTHAREDGSVDGIVLTSEADVQLLHYEPATQRWTPGLR
jgi:prepilin-type N-terminal cleavage/methylation domain-containing protein